MDFLTPERIALLFRPHLLASQNLRVRRGHNDGPDHLSHFTNKQGRSVGESCLHTTQPACSEYRLVTTSLDTAFAMITTVGYSLVPFHQCSPRAGKLCPWAKFCQLQAFVNKVLLECSPTHLFTLCLWLLSHSTSSSNSLRQRPRLSEPAMLTTVPVSLKSCHFDCSCCLMCSQQHFSFPHSLPHTWFFSPQSP